MHKDRREAKIQGRGSVGKVAVMGLLERDGEIRMKVINNTKQETLFAEIDAPVEPAICRLRPSYRLLRHLSSLFL
jgi:hypothetical protein